MFEESWNKPLTRLFGDRKLQFLRKASNEKSVLEKTESNMEVEQKRKQQLVKRQKWIIKDIANISLDPTV